MHQVGMRLICIHVTVQNMEILKQNVIIYKIRIELLLVSVQRTAQTSFRIFLQTRIIMIMVDGAGAKFNSHESGGHF